MCCAHCVALTFNSKKEFVNINLAIQIWTHAQYFIRTQCAVLNDETSNFIDVTSGAPQGVVLGTLLFLILIDININALPQL